MPTQDVNDPYLHEHVRRALVEDERVGETTIRVTHAGGRIFLTGYVTNEERRKAAEAVAREIVGSTIEVKNDLEILEVGGPSVESIG